MSAANQSVQLDMLSVLLIRLEMLILAGLVFRMLLEEGMISEELVDNMNSWKHSGFSVYCAEPIEVCDDNGRKTLSEYISRAPFSLERMSFNENSKTVVYRGEHFHPTLARNFDVSDPLDWIARITAHIPRKGAKQIIYYGAYSQAWRGRERRQSLWSRVARVNLPLRLSPNRT